MPEMKMYIGTKMIKAALMTRSEAEKSYGVKVGGSRTGEGYLVKYPDGYLSWSPKDVFEKAYCKSGNLPFESAVAAMKMGKSIGCGRWKDDVRMQIQNPEDSEEKSNDKDEMTASYFYVKSRFGTIPWIPNMAEMLTYHNFIIK